MNNANLKQIGGNHYAGKIQHWDYVHDALANRYLEGNASKYIFRWRKKNGVQDLEKAHHYIEKIRELHNSASRYAMVEDLRSEGMAEQFCQAHIDDLSPSEVSLLCKLATWETDADLLAILTELNRMIAIERK